MKAVITDWNFKNIEVEKKIFSEAGIELLDFQCTSEDQVCKIVEEADVVIAQWAPVKAKAIASMKNCRGIVRYGIGLDNIDLIAAKEKGIPVKNIPDYCLDEVADHTLALLLSVQRQIHTVSHRVKQGEWKIVPPQPLPSLRSSTLGLIGLGRISQRVAERARAFKMNVIAYDPFASDSVFESLSIKKVELAELFKVSDIISLHCPLTKETHHLIQKTTLAQMKPTAIVINASRGGLIASEDLDEALRLKVISGAGLDVAEEEPLPIDHPLVKNPLCIVTSHVAWYSAESIGELQRLAAMEGVKLLTTEN